ncbi:MAG TPA: hypothetical protein P5320_00490 [Bacteroidales bacterium]|nr:hypothetical protein [Bacteroidales bacterium]HPP91998.1 hypothetical protein [Bacteroidales bacterium]HQG56499.1 hypothetical protein [Bacteroidales bacterium]HQK69497.1 hypothetical protein [Bacteroidales bacterium]HRR15176.1 hypothetical protein [Bacteroidales bacterium]
MMKCLEKILRFYSFFLFILLLLFTGCASSKQNPWAAKRAKASYVSTTQLGRNRYYFSTNYQKKLQKSMKKKK